MPRCIGQQFGLAHTVPVRWVQSDLGASPTAWPTFENFGSLKYTFDIGRSNTVGVANTVALGSVSL